MASIQVTLEQVGRATSEASIRQHRILVDRPEAKGGDDRGPMGGELLLTALGGCFMSNLLAAVRTREAAVDNVHVTVDGFMENAPSRFGRIRMTVTADCVDEDLLQKLVTMSERACISANTLRGGVDLEILAEVRPRPAA